MSRMPVAENPRARNARAAARRIASCRASARLWARSPLRAARRLSRWRRLFALILAPFERMFKFRTIVRNHIASQAGSQEMMAVDCARHGPAIHLCHEGSAEDLSSQPRGPQRHLAVLFSQRQDWRSGLERGRQIDAAPDHGGPG